MKRNRKKNNIEYIQGTLRVHPRGFGFLIPLHQTQCSQDIFIPKHCIADAVDGDLVEVEISQGPPSEKGPEGKVAGILERGRTHLAGTIYEQINAKEALAYVPILGSTRTVRIFSEEKGQLSIGDRIILHVVKWGDTKQETEGTLSHVMGSIYDPSCDVRCAIEEFDLPNTFTQEAIQEALAFGSKVSKRSCDNREDLTTITCLTIDPETAKDFDDALSLEKTPSGGYRLGVHIADVAHYVKEGSALDVAAYTRCNSTYFPGHCLPMLPKELSENLCSLRPQVIRLTTSAFMDFDKKGNLQKSRIVRSFIKSAKRFTYEEAYKIIDGKKKSVHAPLLKDLSLLCQLLKKKRAERGSVDLSCPEIALIVDDKGVPQKIEVIPYDIAHQLVEECMLKANEVVAQELARQGKPLIYRIHEAPSEDNKEDFFTFARSLGFTLADPPKVKDIQNLFEAAKDTHLAQQLTTAFIRSMRLASYSAHNVGHYGLALEHYTHFTSPIRRYIDLVIQRLLFETTTTPINPQTIATKCSEKERISFRAEASVKLLKKLRFLSSYAENHPHQTYTATVTRIKPYGLSFELDHFFVEGFLHVSELEEDFFVFSTSTQSLRGRSSGKRYYAGDKIEIKLLSIDCIFLETKWALNTSRKKK